MTCAAITRCVRYLQRLQRFIISQRDVGTRNTIADEVREWVSAATYVRLRSIRLLRYLFSIASLLLSADHIFTAHHGETKYRCPGCCRLMGRPIFAQGRLPSGGIGLERLSTLHRTSHV